jgi:hypothetical protein
VPEKESDDDFGIVKQWRGRKMHMKKPNMRKDNQSSTEERASRAVGDSEQPKRKRATRSKNVAVSRPVLKTKGKGKGTGKESTGNKENIGGPPARGSGTKVGRGGERSGGKKRKSLVMPKNWSDSESVKDQSQSDASSYMGAATAKKRKVTKTGGTGTAKITVAAAATTAKPKSKPRPKIPVIPKPKPKAKASTKVVRKSTPQPHVSLSSTPEVSEGSDAESASSEDSALVNIRRQLQERALKKLMTQGQEEGGNQSTDDDSEAEANVGAVESDGSAEDTPAQQQSTADSDSDEEEMIDWQDVKVRAKTKGQGRGSVSGSGSKTWRSEPGMQLKPL